MLTQIHVAYTNIVFTGPIVKWNITNNIKHFSVFELVGV